MLNNDQRARVAVILVRARNPGNIGAVARAMHDFGFSDLRVVSDYGVPLEAAQSAVDASDVIARARACATLADAIADCTAVFGTTAVGERDLLQPLDSLAHAAQRIAAELLLDLEIPRASVPHNEPPTPRDEPPTPRDEPPTPRDEPPTPRVALLFGSEKTGLSNAELSHCQRLLTIPMQRHPGIRHPSMNLGQAVAVCLYELVRDTPIAPRGPAEARAPAGETERLGDLLREVLEAAEYQRHHPAHSTAEHLRRLIVRMSVSRTDAPVWMGILRQVLWKLGQQRAD